MNCFDDLSSRLIEFKIPILRILNYRLETIAFETVRFNIYYLIQKEINKKVDLIK